MVIAAIGPATERAVFGAEGDRIAMVKPTPPEQQVGGLEKTVIGALDSTYVPESAPPESTAKINKKEATNVTARPTPPAGNRDTRTESSADSPKKSGAPAGSAGGAKTSQLGDFKLIRKLGQGGMGEVYLAQQISLDRPAALKVLSKQLAGKEDFVKRFYREARAMAKMDHPNAVRVFAVDQDRGIHFVAMEFVDGKSLQDWLEKLGTLSVGDSLHVILRCCEALQVAHAQNMVHRDIKPDNIMLTRRGQVKVADFGLAKALDEEEMSMTQSGTGLGTPYYMAPEQARNAKHVDGRSDIYALGVTLYHLLSGKLPYLGESALEVILAKEKGKHLSLRQAASENPDRARINERLEMVVDKMIAAKPDHRFKDFEEVYKAVSTLGMDSPSLSFIEAPDKVSVASRTSSPANSRQATSAASSARSAVARTSAEDAQQAEAGKVDKEQKWIVQYQRAGKPALSAFTTAQILTAIKSGSLDSKTKAKKNAADSFLPLAQYPEFTSTVSSALVKEKADQKAGDMKAMYAKIDQQQRWWKFWKSVRGFFGAIVGGLGLILWLAFVGAVLLAGYIAFVNRAAISDWVSTKIKGTQPAATAPADPNATQTPAAPQ